MTEQYTDISELQRDIKSLIEQYYKDMGRTYHYDGSDSIDDKPSSWQIEPDFAKNSLGKLIFRVVSVVEDDLSNDI